MIRVLIIEDDLGTAHEMIAELTAAGFVVDHVADGMDGLRRAKRDEHHVITLDRLLPGIDGLELLAELRRERIRTPVLIVSALDEVDERVRGLKAGGDDYLAKPFVPIELSARIEALARRLVDPEGPIIGVGDLVLDRKARNAVRGGRHLDLAPQEFKLLECLARHAGQVVTRTMLFEEVWHYRSHPGANLVDVHIGRLRRKVDRPQMPPLIHTVRKLGFRLGDPFEQGTSRP